MLTFLKLIFLKANEKILAPPAKKMPPLCSVSGYGPVGTVRLFCKGTGTVYFGTLFELKISDFLHITPAFCM